MRERSVDEGLAALRSAGLTILATTADGETPLITAGEILARPTAWLFGNEAHGLTDDLAAAGPSGVNPHQGARGEPEPRHRRRDLSVRERACTGLRRRPHPVSSIQQRLTLV